MIHISVEGYQYVLSVESGSPFVGLDDEIVAEPESLGYRIDVAKPKLGLNPCKLFIFEGLIGVSAVGCDMRTYPLKVFVGDTIIVIESPFPPSVNGGVLPTGLYFSDNGDGTASIGGTPHALSGGKYEVPVTAVNADGSTSKTFTLVIQDLDILDFIDDDEWDWYS